MTVYRFRLYYTTSTIFTHIRNMNQQPFRPIINQQSFLHISTIPRELLTMIASFLDTNSQLGFAHTCKTIYIHHKQRYKEETVTVLYSQPMDVYYYRKYCKVLERWLGETGWTTVKVTTEGISTDSLNNNSDIIRALYLGRSLQLPNELKYEDINALILNIPSKTHISTNPSFLEKFSNLKILSLIHVDINESIISIIPKVSLLKIISLNCYSITDYHFSKIFETCTALKEIELWGVFHMKSIMFFPPQVERLSIDGYFYENLQIDLSRCTQLWSL
jgi:hypothetical protein